MRDIDKKSLISNSPQQTKLIGEDIGRIAKPGSIICLYGDLGTGKTVLTKGIAKGLDVDENDVKSPSYTLLNQYKGRLDIYHIDLFRVDSPVSELEYMGYREFFYGSGLTIIEWADKAMDILPDERVDITLQYINHNTRRIEVIGIHGCKISY